MQKKVLIIDDMQMVRAEMRKFLCPPMSALSKMTNLIQGKKDTDTPEYTVTEARQGIEGVELIAKSLALNSPFDIIIMDMRMPPGIDGAETLRRIRAIDTAVTVVICTAFPDYTLDELEVINGNKPIHLLQKPITRYILLQAIQRNI